MLVALRVDPVGQSFLARGTVQARVGRVCAICNAKFDEAVDADVRLLLAAEDGQGPDADAWEVPFPAAAQACDLTAVVRDALLLDLPSRSVCGKQECRSGRAVFSAGPGPGETSAQQDRRWAALSGLRGGAAASDSTTQT